LPFSNKVRGEERRKKAKKIKVKKRDERSTGIRKKN
jgi:hypothetical protein